MTVCRSCDAPIRWANTGSGKPMPLDPEPRGDGNIDVVFIGGEETAVVLGAADAAAAQIAGHQLYVSHFGTCPQAGAWRRPQAVASNPRQPRGETDDRRDRSD